MPPPQTTPKTALISLLSGIKFKRDALANTADDACDMDAAELEDLVRHCVKTDAVLCVAEAIVLASLNAGTAVQS